MRTRRPTDDDRTEVYGGPPSAPAVEISTPTEVLALPPSPPPAAARVTPPPMRAAASHPLPPARLTPLPMQALSPPPTQVTPPPYRPPTQVTPPPYRPPTQVTPPAYPARVTPPAMPAIDGDPGAPLRMISMKDAAGRARADEPRAAHQVQLRNLSDLSASQEVVSLGNLAPPRDPFQPPQRRLRHDVLWTVLAIVLAGAISVTIWLVAGR